MYSLADFAQMLDAHLESCYGLEKRTGFRGRPERSYEDVIHNRLYMHPEHAERIRALTSEPTISDMPFLMVILILFDPNGRLSNQQKAALIRSCTIMNRPTAFSREPVSVNNLIKYSKAMAENFSEHFVLKPVNRGQNAPPDTLMQDAQNTGRIDSLGTVDLEERKLKLRIETARAMSNDRSADPELRKAAKKFLLSLFE